MCLAELLGRGGTAVELGAGAATTTTVVRDDVSTLVALATADADCNVRASAVGALARLVGGGRFALGGEAVTRLQTVAAHACVDQHHYVRETALTLLVRLATLSSPRARAPAVVAVDTGSGSGRGGGEISQGSGGTVTALVMTPHRRALRMLVDIDPRVRAAALTALLELQRGAVPLDLTTYVDAQRALTDDDETVRSAALGLILSFGTRHPDGVAPPEAVSAATTTRLADNAFVTLCSAVTDLSPRIRAQASALLGDLVDVSEDTLLQTFDKKVSVQCGTPGCRLSSRPTVRFSSVVTSWYLVHVRVRVQNGNVTLQSTLERGTVRAVLVVWCVGVAVSQMCGISRCRSCRTSAAN